MILALETATAACSAALCAADGSVLAEAVAEDGAAHARELLPGVHRVLTEAGVGWDDVDVVAVSLGPGAFTGLRIGLATARALALADGRLRLAGVPTTSALALAMRSATPDGPDARRLVPLIDGKRHEVFTAVYERDAGAGVRAVEGVSVVPAAELTVWLEGRGAMAVGGDGAALYAELLPAAARFVASTETPTAAMVGRAVACGAPGLVWGVESVLPLYGRSPDAVRWPGGGRS